MDIIGDFLTSLRNAIALSKTEVVVPYSKLKWAIAQVLKEEGFLKEIKKVGKSKPRLMLWPIYRDNIPIIQSLKKISKPGLRIYRSAKLIPVYPSQTKTLVVSTSRGVMSHRKAKKRHLGGEIICEVE